MRLSPGCVFSVSPMRSTEPPPPAPHERLVAALPFGVALGFVGGFLAAVWWLVRDPLLFRFKWRSWRFARPAVVDLGSLPLPAKVFPNARAHD